MPGPNEHKPVSFDYLPPPGVATVPGSVSVIFDNSAKIRARKATKDVSGKAQAEAVAVNEVLARYSVKMVTDPVGADADEGELDRAQAETSKALGSEVPHWRSMQTFLFEKNADTAEIAAKLRRLPFVKTAYQTPMGGSATTLLGRQTRSNISATPPVDTYYFQYSPENERDWWWHFNRHKVFQAWAEYGSRPMPKVVIIDNGFYNGGYDLPNYQWSEARDFSGGGYAGTTVSPLYEDKDSHGTKVAYVLGGPANNGQFQCGIAPGAQIAPYRYDYSMSSLSAAIRYAADNNSANVINISQCINFLGGSNETPVTWDPSVAAAISYATNNKNKNVVISAGNTKTDLNNGPYQPGKVGEIIVGGSQANGYEWDDSDGWGTNYGTQVDMVAGAKNILVPKYNPVSGNFIFDLDRGTSLAAPMVAATLAMMREVATGNLAFGSYARNAIIGSSNLGMTSSYNYKWLGENLNIPQVGNENQRAKMRELNAYNAIVLAKGAGTATLVARVFNTDDDTYGTKNWQWSNPPQFGWDGYLVDSIYDLSADGYVSGNQVTFYNGNWGGQHSMCTQVWYNGWKWFEWVNGVATREAPWATTQNSSKPYPYNQPPYTQPLHNTVGATGDTTTGWVYNSYWYLP